MFRWLLGLIVALVLIEPSPAQSVSAAQKKPGSVFIGTELPEFDLTVDGSAVQWWVTDFWNKTVVSGTLPISGSPTTLSFDPGALGYFAVHLIAVKNGAMSSEVIVTCAVLPTPPTPAPDSPFGVATHFAQSWDVSLMDLIAKAGITRLRDENYWSQIEQTQGVYNFSAYTSYMAAAQAKGIEPLMALTFGNPLYDGGDFPYAPYTVPGRTGYANYASQIISHYGTQVKEVEVWNEYNGTFCSAPATNDRPTYYTEMLKKVHEKFRPPGQPPLHPNVKIGGGAAVLVPLSWFEDLFKKGAKKYLDALVIHPYRGVPEGVETEIANLKALTRKYDDNGIVTNTGVEKPIWVTECGNDSPEPARQGMSRYLVRLMTLLRSEGVERASWYFFKDENPFVTGLLYADNSPFGKNAPTTAYAAYAALIKILGNATIVGREATDLRTRIYRFSKDGSQLRVVWSTSETSNILAQASGPLVVTDIMGNSRIVQPVNGYVSLAVNEDPYYISGNITSIQENGRDTLLTDSTVGYSEATPNGYSETTQGSTPGSWQYGYEYGYNAYPAFQLFTPTASSYGYRWESGWPYASLRIDNGHPSYAVAGGNYVAAPTIRRWLSNVSGPITIHGYARRSSDGGNGTGIAVRIDGVIVYSRVVGPPVPPPRSQKDDVVNFTVRANVHTGATAAACSKVDFMIAPADITQSPPNLDITFDAIDYSLQISQPFAAGDPAGGPTGDADGDGLNNHLEEALGSNARKADSAEYAPKLILSPQNYLQFQYHALKAPGELTYQIQASDNLIEWTPAAGATSILQDVPDGDGTRLLEFKETAPVPTGGKHFLRLKVSP